MENGAAKQKMVIPVVFAINDNYVPYFGVALSSLIEYTSREYLYKVHVFYTELGEYNIRRIEGMSTTNVEIQCIDITGIIPEVELRNTNHLTVETLYRVAAPLLLKEYEKILYLDSDIVILRDVAELYSIDIGEHIIGAVEGKHNHFALKYLHKCNIAPEGYFNAGVLIINTQKALEKDLMNEVIKVLDTDIVYQYVDQDALNVVLKGDVYYLPDQWNVEWHAVCMLDIVIESQVNAVKEMVKNPYIVHYTGGKKPWNSPELELSDRFWEHARKTSFYEEIIYKNMPKPIVRTAPNHFQRFVFPWKIIENDSRIIIYGAGVVGKTFLKQIEQTGYCKVLAVADKRKDEITDLDAVVIFPDEIKEFPYDKILVAIENEVVAKEVVCELVNMGYDENKIAWMSPLKKK